MNYYVTADFHGFFNELHKTLDEAGYYTDLEAHKAAHPGAGRKGMFSPTPKSNHKLRGQLLHNCKKLPP